MTEDERVNTGAAFSLVFLFLGAAVGPCFLEDANDNVEVRKEET